MRKEVPKRNSIRANSSHFEISFRTNMYKKLWSLFVANRWRINSTRSKQIRNVFSIWSIQTCINLTVFFIRINPGSEWFKTFFRLVHYDSESFVNNFRNDLEYIYNSNGLNSNSELSVRKAITFWTGFNSVLFRANPKKNSVLLDSNWLQINPS